MRTMASVLYGNRVRPVCCSLWKHQHLCFSLDNISIMDTKYLTITSGVRDMTAFLPGHDIFVFARMSPDTLGRTAWVCRKWRYTIRNPNLWRNACLGIWQSSGAEANYRIVQSLYDGSWRMWLVSMLAEIPTHSYMWSVTTVKMVAKLMNLASKADCVFKGDYILIKDQVETALFYPGLQYTLLKMRLRLRDVPAISHRRGLTPFVFVPFEEAETSVLNLPVDKMDYFVTG
ncbi:hypothetical protein OPV22_020694 [Ensete ventricosum]|uniref:F-box domain-containing protein n=1 Tax=Ensete ventricosum TaxID=4639 RepID=A0AAV8QFG3_ENSVE|nr:hypothetical protein OPV22_020694 [Ensete ventricosum]